MNTISDLFSRELNEVMRARIQALSDALDFQVMMRSHLQHETLRLKKKLGDSHPRSSRLKERLKSNLRLIRALEKEKEVFRIEVPEPAEDGTLVHGRVVNGNKRGIAGLVVYVEDEKGNPLRFLGKAETGVSGYYAFSIDPETFKKMAKYMEKGVFLSVGTNRGKIIHREFEPLKITAGDRALVVIVLNRDDFTKGKEPLVRPVEKPVVKEVKGARLEDIKGIGAKRAEKLWVAGIADMAAFLEADEKTLKEILGNVDISRMKKQGADIIKSNRNASGDNEEE